MNERYRGLVGTPLRMFATSLAGSFVALLVMLSVPTSSAQAATISVGPYTASTTMPFVVPIRITGAIDLTEWTFDLSFDATDLMINTACDPFTDPYCSLLTGPVTEGPFFSSVAMFPTLFLPGFILTNASLEQTGQLLGVYGAWQDPLPGVSGDGILAYIEFVVRDGGTGLSPITIGGQPAAIPEPAPIALLIVGFTLLTIRRRRPATQRP